MKGLVHPGDGRSASIALEREGPPLAEIECPACGGEGGWETVTGYSHLDGSLTGYWTVCDTCGGKHGIIEEPEPVDEEEWWDWFSSAEQTPQPLRDDLK